MGSRKIRVFEVSCVEVQAALVEYMEGDVTPELRESIKLHLQDCSHCSAVYDGVDNILRLVRGSGAIGLPPGFGKRLYKRVRDSLK